MCDCCVLNGEVSVMRSCMVGAGQQLVHAHMALPGAVQEWHRLTELGGSRVSAQMAPAGSASAWPCRGPTSEDWGMTMLLKGAPLTGSEQPVIMTRVLAGMDTSVYGWGTPLRRRRVCEGQ
jgi:hypothetical protein